MKLRFKSLKRGIKKFFRRDHGEQEYRRLAIEHSKLQKPHADTPHQGETTPDDVALIASISTVEEQPDDTVFRADEGTLPRQVAEAVNTGNSTMRARHTRQVSDHMLQSPNKTLPVQRRSVTMPELGNRMSQATVAHNVPMGREEVLPVRRRSSRIARVPVEPDQRYPSFVRF